MSTTYTIKRIQNQIDRLNDEIDYKIIKGLSYKALSKKHRALIEELSYLKRKVYNSQKSKSVGFFGRLAQYASVFLL